VDEILGPINEVYFTIKMDAGMIATSFKKDDKVYIAGDKLLPIDRFLPKPKQLTKGESHKVSYSFKENIQEQY
jgi:H/ACA ribonucleoprotein complex subunit 1